jgi:5'(3')-deoxyribonucleotidase
MKRIAIDMDEVIADAPDEYLQRYNTDFDAKLTKQDVIGKRLAELAPPEHLARLRGYFHEESFFRDLEVMEDSQDVIHDLMGRYEVYVVTAAMEVPCSFTAKFQWLAKHFPFLPPDNIVFCGNKGIIAADYLIDDNVYQLDRFRGEGILFSTPHNFYESKYKRVADWPDVRKLFLDSPEMS